MKTTIQISDSLLKELKKITRQDGETMKSLVEEGLRLVISRRARKEGFHLRRATFKGKGLQSGVSGAGWDEIREMSYNGRNS
ncbi:MAG: type II toxin-antitoxin system VapB family antitoxin [Spirochaetes bacterium]|nr:type II toxin-antitoxin system VapB family antitoxin [Spirochaetota bacterium]